VVDNGSDDGTAAYLAGVRDMASVPVTVVTNLTNLGFPAAVNQGLRLARGEYLVLLNNDVVVTDGWLDQLIALVNAKRPSVVSGPLSRTENRRSVRDLSPRAWNIRRSPRRMTATHCMMQNPPRHLV
jgi:GT2 family glycosyltransferase